MTRRTLLCIVLVSVVASAARLGAHDEFRFIGTVTKMDVAAGRLFVTFIENKKEDTVEVRINTKTEITRDKKAIPRAQLKVGLYVVVDALGDDYDDLEATAIRVVPKPAK